MLTRLVRSAGKLLKTELDREPAYGVYASQLIRYTRCYSNYSDFLSCHRVTKLIVCPTHLRNSMADILIHSATTE